MHKILIVGDLFPSAQNYKSFISGDITKLFGEEIVKLFKESEYNICNLEGALTTHKQPIGKIGPNISFNPEVINAYKLLGINYVLTANNHIADYGIEGYKETIATLERHQIEHIGSSEEKSNLKKYFYIETGGKVICVYNVAETMFNTIHDTPVYINLYDEYLVCKELKELKKNCDYLIVLYHGGIERFPFPSPAIKKRFHRMADNGANLVVAQHTHCIGCEEVYNGTKLIYGQGNFLFARMSRPITRSGFIIELQIDDTITINKHLFSVDIEKGALKMDIAPNWEEYDYRSSKINNDDFIEEQLFNFSTQETPNLLKSIIPRRGIRKWLIKFLVYIMKFLYNKEDYNRLYLFTLYMLRSEQINETIKYSIYNNFKYDKDH